MNQPAEQSNPDDAACHLDAARINHLMAVYRDGLLHDTLPFWLKHGVDREYGGFLTCLDRDGSLLDTDKGVWQQGRATWLFGELYNHVEQRTEWLDVARLGVQFLARNCVDPTDGRMWFHVTRDGRPVRKRRYAFSESFAAIAYGEIAQATQETYWADMAAQAFDRFLQHHLHPDAMGPKYTNVRPMKSIALPMITIATAQQLRDSIQLSDANAWIDRSIEVIHDHHMKQDIQCVMESVGPRGEILDHFDGRTLNPGHAMEGAWFVMYEGKVRGDQQLVTMGCQMLDWMWHRGWDRQYGGILYFVDVRGLPVQEYWHDMKFWWPHNETIIASLLAYQLTGAAKYARWHSLVHDWSYRHFPDEDMGEWYGYLHRDGSISVPLKGNLWKGPFHLPRMQLVCWKLLEEMRAARFRKDPGMTKPE